jgi:phage terminase large subunit-like protein
VAYFTRTELEGMSDMQRADMAGTLHEILSNLSPQEAEDILYDWSLWRRPSQKVPLGMGDVYRAWFIRAGRGYGKTRTGAETARQVIMHTDRLALIGVTRADARDVMVEGESGIMSCFPPHERPEYIAAKRRITFHNGARAYLYSAEDPERLRGPQHGWAWLDEPASMRNGADILSNTLLGLRLGQSPWLLLTGTPKPVKWLRDLAARPDTVVTSGSTYENIANLASTFIEDVMGRYEGTRLGRQELHAEWLDDVEGALFVEKTIDAHRIASWDTAAPWASLNQWRSLGGQPPIQDRRAWRTIVAVDPPGETAECGIVVGSAPTQSRPGIDHAVVLEDASLAGRPEEWGARVVSAARRWNAERVVVESNQGGDMTRATIHAVDPTIRVDKITARAGKAARAEPVSALYERGLVHHVGFMPMLESQLVTWVPSDAKSPDRLDALVHCIAQLLLQNSTSQSSVRSPSARRF